MLSAITFCFSDPSSEIFKRGIIRETKSGIERKAYLNFEKGTYSVCHQTPREKIESGGTLFFRTTCRDDFYIIDYFEISEKRDGEFGKILVAKNRVCIDFNLHINHELLVFLRPGLKIDLLPAKRSWVQYVNYTLGYKKHIVLNEEKTKSLLSRIKQNGWT